MKVCVFGNSHVAAYKTAEAELCAAYPSWQIDFFGAPFPQVDGLACDARGIYGPDQTLMAAAGLRPRGVARMLRDVNGREALPLGEYDAAFLVGHYVKVKDIIRMIADNDIDGYDDGARACRMSRAAFTAMASEIIATHIPESLAHMAGATKVWVSIIPFLSSACLEDDGTEYGYLRRAVASGADITPQMVLVHQLLAKRFAEVGLAYLPQPQATAPQQILTDARFSRGSRRLVANEAHGARDYLHMNAAYAVACFDDFTARILHAPASSTAAGAM